ncbi:MAG: sugar ABC transporter substrate-binding protein [Lachnospiraceae bacterium]|nr:sugar ABC transporter substrate-binding protein [Lachnospiraceae bacterium]
MKKNALQKVLALAMVGAMAMGTLAGCGSTQEAAPADTSAATTTESATSTDTTAAETTAEAAADEVAGMEGWEPFAETVTLKVPVYDRGAEGVPDVSNNYWTKWIQENFGDKYNINVEYVGITRSDVLTDYALLAAADDLPTILMEYDFPKQAKWVTDGYLTTFDMNEFAKVAPTYYARMEELGLLKYSELNGETYFCLAERPYSDTNYTFVTFYRTDWAEQVGYDSYPATWADQKDMLLKIKEAGLSEYPLGGSMVSGAGVDQNYAYREFPFDEEDWAVYGDYNVVALGNPANKKLIQRENEKYNLGLIDPEYYTIDAETAKSNFVNGKSFQWSGYISGSMDFLTGFYENNPDGKLAVAVSQNVVDKDGGTTPAFRANNPFGMMVSFSSSATEDEIKAAWMYMEWLSQEENLFTFQWGIEGENYTMGENGLPVATADYDGEYKQGFNNSKDYWCIVVEARNAGTIEDIIHANTPHDLPQEFEEDIVKNYYAQVEIAEAGYAVHDCMFAVDIEAVGEYSATLAEKYTVYRDNLTMCDPAEFDALYDQYAQEYADAGYAEIAEERLEAYQNGMTSKLQ